ncbi:MAG TPA: hypothetical protein VEH06_09750 [Candidatus Bathyarchaeia archaeon]|nr:hypothetical protein [Candidatus Bathyarchaeia archaeon]
MKSPTNQILRTHTEIVVLEVAITSNLSAGETVKWFKPNSTKSAAFSSRPVLFAIVRRRSYLKVAIRAKRAAFFALRRDQCSVCPSGREGSTISHIFNLFDIGLLLGDPFGGI